MTRQISLFAADSLPPSPDRVAKHMYEPRYDQGTICGSILIGGMEVVSSAVGEDEGGILTGYFATIASLFVMMISGDI